MSGLIDRYSRLRWQVAHPITVLRQRWLVWKYDRRMHNYVNEIHLESRADVARLLTMKDETGFPIFNVRYDKQQGLKYTFLGKPVYWPEGE